MTWIAKVATGSIIIGMCILTTENNTSKGYIGPTDTSLMHVKKKKTLQKNNNRKTHVHS